MKVESIKPLIVEFMPKELEEGILYYSPKFSLAIHLCACGCGEKTVTPIKKGEWSLEIIGDKVTLNPSIGNFNPPPYHAHYFIRDGKVIPA